MKTSQAGDVCETSSANTGGSSESWPGILRQDDARWKALCADAKGGRKILVTNAFGINSTVSHFDSVVAAALTVRGAEVHILHCDQVLPACWNAQWDLVTTVEEFTRSGTPRSICEQCFSTTNHVFGTLGLPVHKLSELITTDDKQRAAELSSSISYQDIQNYNFEGLAIGEQAFAGAVRFMARGDLSEPYGEAVLRRYLNAALQCVFATRRLRTEFPFECLVNLHGMYVPEGVFCEVARQQKARVVNWMFTYRKRTCTLSHLDTYARQLQYEPTEVWENLLWTPKMEAQILDYLESRRFGTNDWHRFIQNPQEDLASISQEIGVDLSKQYAVLLTNVVWDAQIYYPANAFSSMMEWVLETINYFAKRPDLQLVIRVHPAEVLATNPARQTAISEVRRVFPTLPANVFIIPPESRISTYSISLASNAVLIYGTIAGIELASRGVPVFIAGDAVLRNKGIGLEASSREDYIQLLEQLPLKGRLSEETTKRALKYAYHFFFRRMVPIPFTATNPATATVRSIDELKRGAHPGLDVICDGILDGAAFIYRAELHPITEDTASASPDDRSSVPQESLWVACNLTKIGEVDRARVHLLSTLRQYPFAVQEPRTLSTISAIALAAAMASDRPMSAIERLRRETQLVLHDSSVPYRMGLRHAFGYAVFRVAVNAWKKHYYIQALQMLLRAALYDPARLINELPRLLRRMTSPVARALRLQPGTSA